MAEKIFRWNFWSKILILMLLCSIGILYIYYDGSRKEIARLQYELRHLYKSKGYVTTSPNLKFINVMYRGDVYQILDTENFIDRMVSELSFSDTLLIDSLSFNKVKEAIVIPQPKIDSIYKYGAKSLISQYFEEGIPKLYLEYKETDSIPPNRLMELEYAITVLIRDGHKIFSDCETGIPMLAVKE